MPLFLAILLLGPACRAGSLFLSSTGSLATSSDTFAQVFTLSAPQT